MEWTPVLKVRKQKALLYLCLGVLRIGKGNPLKINEPGTNNRSTSKKRQPHVNYPVKKSYVLESKT